MIPMTLCHAEMLQALPVGISPAQVSIANLSEGTGPHQNKFHEMLPYGSKLVGLHRSLPSWLVAESLSKTIRHNQYQRFLVLNELLV